MKGTEKQIRWAKDIISDIEGYCNQVIQDAEAYERTGDATICRPIKVEVAQQLKAMVLDGLAQIDSAAEIIDNRGRFSYDSLVSMAIQFSK